MEDDQTENNRLCAALAPDISLKGNASNNFKFYLHHKQVVFLVLMSDCILYCAKVLNQHWIFKFFFKGARLSCIFYLFVTNLLISSLDMRGATRWQQILQMIREGLGRERATKLH